MSKICAVDNQKIGAMTGYVKLKDGYVCRPHWKQAGFNTTSDVLKYQNTLLVEQFKSGENIKDSLKSIENSRIEEIRQQFIDAGVSDMWGTKKEFKALPDILADDETVKYATSGLFNGNTVLMLTTDSRILFIDKGMIKGTEFTEIPLEMVNAVNYKTGLMMGAITITNGSIQSKVENVEKKTAPIMVDTIKRVRDEFMQKRSGQSTTVVNASSDAEELLKFKMLLDQDVITQEEFDAKKKQILGL